MADAKELLKRGQEKFFAGYPDLAAAESIFRQVTQLSPEWGEGFLWLGSSLARQKKLPEAQKTYIIAIGLLPKDSRPYISLGRCLQQLAHHEEAVKYFEQGIAL